MPGVTSRASVAVDTPVISDPPASARPGTADERGPSAAGDPPGASGLPATDDSRSPDIALRRICRKRDFPAMSAAISAINRVAAADDSHIQNLSNVILKDFALTNTILRVANSALYRRCGGGLISTISRAIVVLGFDEVRRIALSLTLFEHLRNKEHADVLLEDFLFATMSGVIGRNFAVPFAVQAQERSFICALLHSLGRLLTHYYLPEDTRAIARLAAREQCHEDAAVLRTLRISYQDLGLCIASDWGFPNSILHSMKRVPPGRIALAHSDDERLRLLSGFANETCAALRDFPPDTRDRELRRIRSRYGDNLPLGDPEADRRLRECIDELAQLVRALGINPARTRLGRNLLANGRVVPVAPEATGAGIASAADTVDAMSLPGPATADGDTATAAATGVDAQAVLAAGIQDISHALAESDTGSDVLQIILETLYRALGFKRVLLCLRNGATGIMAAHAGFGAQVEESVERFRFPLGGRNDIFNVILASDRNVLIRDVQDPRIVPLVPDWFRLRFPVQSFIVFPLRIRGTPVAMIYADKDYADSIDISERDMPLIRTLCNQAVLAIRLRADHR